jgi:hypothetical protein
MADEVRDTDTRAERVAADFDGHRRAQILRRLRTTPAERLRWLEEAIEFAHRAGALPRRRGER